MPAVGVEPTTLRLKGGYSTIELHQPSGARTSDRGVRNGRNEDVFVFLTLPFRTPSSAIRAAKGSGGWNRTNTSAFRARRSTVKPYPGISASQYGEKDSNLHVTGFKDRWPTVSPSPCACSSGGRIRTCIMRFNRAPPYRSAPHRCDLLDEMQRGRASLAVMPGPRWTPGSL